MKTIDIHDNIRTSRSRVRLAAAAIAAAGAVAAGALGPVAPANANQTYWVALAYSFRSDIGGVKGLALSEQDARYGAQMDCQNKGGNHCTWFGSFENTCAALAVLGQHEWKTATGSNRSAAEQAALAANPGGRIVASGCASNPAPPVKTTIPRPTLSPGRA